jgi:hypothetical protein
LRDELALAPAFLFPPGGKEYGPDSYPAPLYFAVVEGYDFVDV